jgi:lipopolysaccharide transport system permease protein
MSSTITAPDATTLAPGMPVPAAPAAELPRLKIRPAPGWKAINFRELWQFRELLWFLALRDIKVRYKQTALGVAWAVLQPLLTMLVFTLFFGRLAGLDQRTGPILYSVFVFCALVPWQRRMERAFGDVV